MWRGNHILVSVCIPAYQAEDFLQEAIESVLRSQGRGTDFDLEIYVADDASTDSTREIAEELARLDGCVRLLTNPHRLGIGGNVNRVLQAASGQFLTILPADCLMMPSGIATRVRSLAADPEVALCWGGAELIDKDGSPLGISNSAATGRFDSGPAALSQLLPWNPVYPSTAMFTRDAFEATGGYRWHITSSHMDWDMFLRMAVLGAVLVLDEVVACERIHEGNFTADAVTGGRTPFYEAMVLSETSRWVRAQHPELLGALGAGMQAWSRSRIAAAALARSGLRPGEPGESLGLAFAIAPRIFLAPRTLALLGSFLLPRSLMRALLRVSESGRALISRCRR